MSDDEKLQAIIDHFESVAASPSANETSFGQRVQVQELLLPPPLQAETAWTPRGMPSVIQIEKKHKRPSLSLHTQTPRDHQHQFGDW